MNRMRSIVLIGLLNIALCAAPVALASTTNIQGAKMNEVANAAAGVHDFDFFVGRWRVHHRRLKERLLNNHEWVHFEGTTSVAALAA